MPHVNKKTTSENWKFNSNKKLGLEWAVNDRENHLEKKSGPKNRKTVKIRVKLPHVNKKPLPRNRIFVQTPFSHSTLKLERKKFTPQNHSLFRSISCFGVTKITTCWTDLKKNVWTDLKKKTAPQYNSNSLNCKKTAPQYNSNSLNCKKDRAPIQFKFFEL